MTSESRAADSSPVAAGLSIRTRLLLWATGVTGVLLLAVIAWNYLSLLERLEADAREKVAFLAEGSADKIDAKLGRVQGLVQGIALLLEAQALQVPFERVRALQDAALASNPEIYGTAVALEPSMKPDAWPDAAPYAYRSGNALAYQNLDDESHPQVGEDWFSLPRYLDRGVWSEPYLWTTGVKMVTYSVPLHVPSPAGPRFAGVVTVDIEIGWLDRLLAELPLGEQGYGVLMTRNGTYISHPIEGLALNESIFSIAEGRGNDSLREIGQRMVSGSPGLVPWVSWAHGVASWLAWEPLATADWTVGTVISKDALRAEILRLTRNEALVGGAGLTLLVLAVWLVARSITRPVVALSAASKTLASGDLDAALPAPRGADEVAQLTAAFAAMRDSLKRHIADLAATTAARERMNSELRIAHDIQMDLVPKTFPPAPRRDDMDLFALMEPAREVGGDFYDFFFLDDDRLALAIADVSGKGVPAALFMAVTRSFLRSELRIDAYPGRALTRVSDELSEGNESCMFVTLFCAVVRLSDGTVEFANAGHNAPLIVRADGRIEWIDRPRGVAAAAMPGASYETGSFVLSAGDSLLLYTDGVTEAMDAEGRLYGEARLASALVAGVSAPCRECLGALLGGLRAHAAGTEQSDDITMLLLKRLPGGNGAGAQQEPGAPAEEDGWLRFGMANRLDALAEGLDRLDRFLEAQEAPLRLAYVAHLALEEVVTNIVKYGYDDRGAHRIGVAFGMGPPATMTIEDRGRPFDPLVDAPPPDLDATVEDRRIGGLGLHIVRTMTASARYRYEDGVNRLTIEFGP